MAEFHILISDEGLSTLNITTYALLTCWLFVMLKNGKKLN
jgi:hypothetical protein